MGSRVLMEVGEYLHTSFEGADCEYLDGEVVARNTGELPHAKIQITLGSLLRNLRKTLGILVSRRFACKSAPAAFAWPISRFG